MVRLTITRSHAVRRLLLVSWLMVALGALLPASAHAPRACLPMPSCVL